jgi:hypothetical protein
MLNSTAQVLLQESNGSYFTSLIGTEQGVLSQEKIVALAVVKAVRKVRDVADLD